MGANSSVTLELSGSEALVLFELLSRWSDDTTFQASSILNKDTDGGEYLDAVFIKHQAEQRVLWNVVCMLESRLVEPFRADYLDILSAAREAVRDKE